MAYQYIQFDRSDGVGSVTLNRPEQLNSLTPAMLQELADVFRGMERDPNVRAIIITGAGRAFCGGEDFRQRAEAELGTAQPTRSTPKFETFNNNFQNNPDEGGAAPYNPTSLPNQPTPQPLMATEFSPLNPTPLTIENPRTQPAPLDNGTGRPSPLFDQPDPLSTSARPFTSPNQEAPLGDQVRRLYNPFIRQLRSIEKPVIAAVNGIAAGTGLGLALACDIRYAAERARFVEVSVRVGLLPGGGTAYFLPRLIGLSKALELAFNGDELNAAEAERLGLVSRVVPGSDLLEETRKLATRLAKGPTRAIGLTKSMLYRSANLNLDQALELEAQLLDEASRTQDYKEGLHAFVEKRSPNYKGQ